MKSYYRGRRCGTTAKPGMLVPRLVPTGYTSFGIRVRERNANYRRRCRGTRRYKPDEIVSLLRGSVPESRRGRVPENRAIVGVS